MKRRELIAALERMGGERLRHGAKHDIYRQPKTGRSEPVPRHREINEFLARRILRSLAPPSESGR
ncbi:MAG: type II toxin-antitoxin system HicA family toxin [Opitutaceae bacterium]